MVSALQLLIGCLVKAVLCRLKLDDEVKDGPQLGQDFLQPMPKSEWREAGEKRDSCVMRSKMR